MSKHYFLLGWFIALVLLLVGCQSYYPESGQGLGMTNGTKPGQFPGAAATPGPRQFTPVNSNPNTQTQSNPNPPTPGPLRATVVPQSPLSQPNQSTKWDDITDWLVYKNNPYHYQVDYPPELVVKVLSTAELSKLKPQPVTVINFSLPPRGPSTGSSGSHPDAIGVMIPPAFSIRIYDMGAGTSLEDWLRSNGLYLPDSGWKITAYHGSHFSGYQVNSSMYMAPGWFIVATKGNYLYQLIPMGNQAETMLNTFEFTP